MNFSNIVRAAAFSYNNNGGNPAGILIADKFASSKVMLDIAKRVGFSETVFAVCQNNIWFVRYFSPLVEVPFCGHATIALGAQLAKQFGTGKYIISAPVGKFEIYTDYIKQNYQTTLRAPPIDFLTPHEKLITKSMNLFDIKKENVDLSIPPIIAGAGVKHLILHLNDYNIIKNMNYNISDGKSLMDEFKLTTIMLSYKLEENIFIARNAFASSGIFEDPATGAAAAAFAAYLSSISDSSSLKPIKIFQGEEAGRPSVLNVKFSHEGKVGIYVSGQVSFIM